MFKLDKLDNGRPIVHIHAGSMKNLQQTMDKNETVIFKQTMITGDDPRFCPVAAFNRQLNILEVDVSSSVPLFQSCSAFAAKFSGKVAKYGTYRGVADWVSKIVGRSLTFRQCSRNVVFTKLANDPCASDNDKAKFMGVSPKTIAVYHKTSDEKRFACSVVVCNVRAGFGKEGAAATKVEHDVSEVKIPASLSVKKRSVSSTSAMRYYVKVIESDDDVLIECHKGVKRPKTEGELFLDEVLGEPVIPDDLKMKKLDLPTKFVQPIPIEVDEWDYDACPLTQESEKVLDMGERLEYEKMKYRKSVLNPQKNDSRNCFLSFRGFCSTNREATDSQTPPSNPRPFEIASALPEAFETL